MTRLARQLSKPLGLLGGVYLAGLPTYYALFTIGDSGTGASEARKAAIPLFIVWVAVALIVGYLTLLKDGELLQILLPARRQLKHTRENDAVLHAVKRLIADPRFSNLRPLRPSVFICDDRDRPVELAPLGATNVPDWQRWRIGYGAVGAAFEANKDVVLAFEGAELGQLNASLTDDQLQMYGNLQLVAACALRGADGVAVGVLSASSETKRRLTPARIDNMRILGSELGVLLDIIA